MGKYIFNEVKNWRRKAKEWSRYAEKLLGTQI